MTRVLLIGSAPNSIIAKQWDSRKIFDKISAINNACKFEDWNDLIYPHDLLPSCLPKKIKRQQLIDEKQFVPAQNKYGGYLRCWWNNGIHGSILDITLLQT